MDDDVPRGAGARALKLAVPDHPSLPMLVPNPEVLGKPLAGHISQIIIRKPPVALPLPEAVWINPPSKRNSKA